ncbi:MAG: glycosyltransferase [Gemmatimonadetes bacterium]|nr:MAG: glycosyltransferase [Gemmatimonadota bacterium]
MKVFITNSSRVWGGNENWAVTTAEGLQNAGHTVKLILKAGGAVQKRATARGLSVIALERFGGDAELPALLRFYRLFRREQPDAIILTNTKDYWVCGLTSYLAGVPKRILRLSMVRRIQNNIKYKLIYTRFSTHVIVNSREVETGIRQSAAWLQSIPIEVVYNGVSRLKVSPPREQPLELPSNAFVIGACANITTRKRFDWVIRAVAESSPELNHAQVVLVGEGSALPDLQKLAEQLHVTNRIHFPGYTSDPHPWYHLFDLNVLPSQQEGMPTAILEAMAQGCPTLATDCGGVRELLNNGECGMIVGINDYNGFKQALIDLASQPDRLATYRKNSIERVKTHFTHTKLIEHLNRILMS